MLTAEQLRFINCRRVAHLATADTEGVPHIVPVCFAVEDATLYIAIDEKPKRGTVAGLKRLRNIAANSAVSLMMDHYDEDWSKLAWVRVDGDAEILTGGHERDAAHVLLRRRYPQYAAMSLEHLPVIAVRITHATGWGAL